MFTVKIRISKVVGLLPISTPAANFVHVDRGTTRKNNASDLPFSASHGVQASRLWLVDQQPHGPDVPSVTRGQKKRCRETYPRAQHGSVGNYIQQGLDHFRAGAHFTSDVKGRAPHIAQEFVGVCAPDNESPHQQRPDRGVSGDAGGGQRRGQRGKMILQCRNVRICTRVQELCRGGGGGG